MTFDNLPKQFLSAVRVLFDVLDRKNLGFVEFRELETKWNRENTYSLPSDAVECLHSVTPANGHLTFELFVTGLQKSLLQSGSRDLQFDHSATSTKPLKPFDVQPDPYKEQLHDPAEFIYQRPHRKPAQFSEGGRSQSIADIPAQPITSPQHRPTYRESDAYRRQVPRKRDSGRRHTLGHGVDGSMVRRSKLLEEERRMLLTGLQSVDRAKDWYSKRLAEVAEKQRYGAPETSDQSSTDQHQERINFEGLRIAELSQQIDALTEPHAQGGLMRMNLARPISQRRQQTIPYEPSAESVGAGSGSTKDVSGGADNDTAHALQLMRAQNRMLTKELSQKGDRVSQLEKDKATLLKDLFEVRARHRVQQQRSVPPQRQLDESTLM